jgi:hypothetical protein
MENFIDVKNILSMIEEGANPKDFSLHELDMLSDYVTSEGIKYETLPDSLKFNVAFASSCKQRGIILPDIVMYYCFN